MSDKKPIRNVPESLKKIVAGKQNFKCANNPDTIIKGLEDFECHLWKINKGDFDESCYEIDHKVPHCISYDDNDDNLQALCNACHAVKTKRFIAKQAQQNTLIREKQIIEKKNNVINDKDEQIINKENNVINNSNKDEQISSKYQCHTCKRNFRQKCHLDDHLNKKIKCQPIIDIPQNNIIIPQNNTIVPINNGSLNDKLDLLNNILPKINDNLDDNYQCNYCNKTFARRDVVTRHIKNYCPIVKQQKKDKQEIYDKLTLLESNNKQLEEEIKNKNKQIEIKDKLLEEEIELNKKHCEEIKNLKNKIKNIQSLTPK